MQTTIPGEYGTTVLTNDGRRDPTQAERDAERRADRILYPDMRKRFTCDDAAFESLITRADFPSVIGYITTPRRVAIFSRAAVNKWIAVQRALHACLPKKGI